MIEAKEITDLSFAEDIKKLYINSFPPEELVDFDKLFSGVFETFKLFAFYKNNSLVGMAHFNECENYIHLNYLAVDKNYQSQGIGSFIISWLKERFNYKTLVVDIEEISELAANNNLRIKRKSFYKKNGFNEGVYVFYWEGVFMTYMYTNSIDSEEFMIYIQKVFPTINNIRRLGDNEK